MKLKKIRNLEWRTKAALFVFLLALLSFVFVFDRSAAAPCSQSIKSSKVTQIKTIPPSALVKSAATQVSGSDKSILKLSDITLPPAHNGLDSSSEPQLQKLAQYEQTAGGALANGMMVFTNTPVNTTQAQSHASDILACIKDFAKYGVKPVVIMEPSTDNGSVVNFPNYRNGAYDSVLDSFFSYLKNHGVADSEMGMWVYFPESNLPEWGPVDVADYAANVTRTVNIQKKYFPNSLSSIMLDAESYPAGDTDWGNGSYTSLSPFIGGIPKGTLDSFGLQGFPWAPAANVSGESPSYDPSVYLDANLAIEAANYLGVKNIWLNTGTFHAMYTNSKNQTVYMSPSQRQDLLNGVLNQAALIKNKGFKTEVNLFSEDKSNTDEATDWSYKSANDQTVLKTFSQQLYGNGIDLWLFDS